MSVVHLAEHRVPWSLALSAQRAAIDGAYRLVWQGALSLHWAGAVAAQLAEWVGWKWKAEVAP